MKNMRNVQYLASDTVQRQEDKYALQQEQQQRNGSSEVRRKLLTLNCNILKKPRRKKAKFGENAVA